MVWTTGFSLHAEDSIRKLRVEQIGLFFDAPKRILKLVDAPVSILTKVHRVPHYVAIVVGTFRIPLIKLAPVAFET